jgi:chemotaxis signal transduction protein
MLTLKPLPLSTKAREIRRAFDESFALPPPPMAPPTVALLLVRVAGELMAIRRTDMAGFARGENLAPMPSGTPAFLGLAGLRGGLYPVWSLAALLGRSPPPVGSSCWLVLAETQGAPCAFACEAFEKMIFVPAAGVVGSAQHDDEPAGFIPAMASWESALVPVIDLPALQAHIWKRKESTQPRRTTP